MKFKKGFTLIELLAVIVILAIIALITVPMVVQFIEDAQRGADRASVSSIIESSKHYFAKSILGVDLGSDLNGTTNILDKIEVDGEKPESGVVFLNSEGKIQLAVVYGNTCFMKFFDSGEITENNDTENCIPPVPYSEEILMGSDPVLDDGMIPVTIENNGTVKKASIYNQWYKYENKDWANVILVKKDATVGVQNSKSRSDYLAAEEGTVILENDIVAYYVWIPRYEYETIINTSASEINIRFISKSKTVPTSNFIIHPSFTFDNKQISGIWVGKFETTGTIAEPTIKPNLVSISDINISTMFATSLLFKTLDYGLVKGDAHMMKNTDWGAATYLAQSKYGLCTSGTCAKISINNSSQGKTGSSYGGPGTTNSHFKTVYAYNTAGGYSASTTRKITGIYDMSGGRVEMVMGVMTNASGVPYSGYSASNNYNSGFKGPYTSGGSNTTGVDFPDPKYYDTYAPGTVYSDYTRGLTGDATRETALWQCNNGHFVHSSWAWFARGGNYADGATSCIFTFSNNYGMGSTYFTFRSVVVVS